MTTEMEGTRTQVIRDIDLPTILEFQEACQLGRDIFFKLYSRASTSGYQRGNSVIITAKVYTVLECQAP